VTGKDQNSGRTHGREELMRGHRSRNAYGERDRDSQKNRLRGGDGSASGVLFADAAGNHGGGGQADAERDGKYQHQHGFGEADRGDGVCAQASHPEHVDQGKQRLHQHLEHHGDGEQDDRAADRKLGKVLMAAFDRLGNGAPER
jgi:hypothetical protein